MRPGPDLVIYAEARAIAVQSGGMQQNPARRRKLREAAHPPELAGLEQVVFQVALVRPDTWRPGDKGPKITTAADAVAICEHLGRLDHERVIVLCLDAGRRLIAIHEAGVGGLHGCALTPRDAAKVPVIVGAACAILLHNHPSGDPTPSPEDVQMTRATQAAFTMLGIQLLDHIVIAARYTYDYGSEPAGFSSMRELGLVT